MQTWAFMHKPKNYLFVTYSFILEQFWGNIYNSEKSLNERFACDNVSDWLIVPIILPANYSSFCKFKQVLFYIEKLH